MKKSKKSKKTKTVRQTSVKSAPARLASRKWSLLAAATASSVEVRVDQRCSTYKGAADNPPSGSALAAFYGDYAAALRMAVSEVGWPVADSNAKPDKEMAIEWFHNDEVVPRMTPTTAFRFSGPPSKSRQSPNGWDDDPNLAGVHWAVYDASGFVRWFGLDERL